MKKVSSYEILPQINLVIEYFQGPVTINDIIELRKAILKNIEFYPLLNFIIDIRETQLMVSKQDLIDYVNFLEGEKQLISKRKTAILTNTPQQVAKATIYESLIRKLPIEFSIFSTLEGALNWVSVKKNLEYSMIESTLLKLKNDLSNQKYSLRLKQRI